jgi:hypothetical protein
LTLLDLLVEAPDPTLALLEGRETEAKVAKLAKEVERLQGQAIEAGKESEEAKELRDKVKRLEANLAGVEESLKVSLLHFLACCLFSPKNTKTSLSQPNPTFQTRSHTHRPAPLRCFAPRQSSPGFPQQIKSVELEEVLAQQAAMNMKEIQVFWQPRSLLALPFSLLLGSGFRV